MIIVASVFHLSVALMQPPLACDEGDIQLRTDFPAAGGEDCMRTEEGFTLNIVPEAIPINRSPWYAFDLIAPSGTDVSVTLNYTYARHRYVPKQLDEMGIWKGLAADRISLSEDGMQAVLTLTGADDPVRIAAQPVIPSNQRREWVETYAERAGFTLSYPGRSLDGQALPRLTSRPASRNGDVSPVIVLLGSQHPPEVPGWLAMMAFLDRLAEDDQLAREFRETYRIEAFPVLNPDGIDAGYWRFNAGLVDLNRDWGPFEQPESRLVWETIEELKEKGQAPVLLIDFHAIDRGDILFTPERSLEISRKTFPDDWAARIEQLYGTPGFEVISSHNPGLPTAKTWFAEQYRAPGITFEIGDKTSPQRIEGLGDTAAEAMMELMLAPPAIEPIKEPAK